MEALQYAFLSSKKPGPPPAEEPSHLYQEIGKLQIELGWLKTLAIYVTTTAIDLSVEMSSKDHLEWNTTKYLGLTETSTC